MIRFSGLIAPTEVPTGDGRMFAAGKMTHRPYPVPVLVRFGSGGHDGAVSVGIITDIYDGPGGYWCKGEFLDPAMVPEVPRAVYLLQKKAIGPSVDLDRDFTVEAIPHPTRPDKKAGVFKEYNVIGVTLVPMPAFHQVHMSVENELEKVLTASVGIDPSTWQITFESDVEQSLVASAGANWEKVLTFDVNVDSWRNWPIAPRDYKFDADDAVKRIAYWSGIGSKQPSIPRYSSAFLWRNGNQTGDSLAQDSFRLPLADIINGQPYLIYHAVYSAAALLSGAHGGIPQIPDADKAQMVRVINEIYPVLAAAFRDDNLKSPFLVGVRTEQMSLGNPEEWSMDSSDCGCNNVSDEVPDLQGNPPVNGVFDMSQTITVNSGEQTYTVSSSEDRATANVTITFTPANLPLDVLKSIEQNQKPWGEDGCHFDADGFCVTHMGHAPGHDTAMKPYGDVPYADPGYQEDGKHRYPIDRPSHIRAAWSYVNMKRNAAKYALDKLDMIKKKIRAAAEENGIEITDNGEDEHVELANQTEKMGALLAGAAPLAPPAAWFRDPGLAAPTKLTIDDDGHMYGHLAQWKVCHVGIGNACVIAPRSRTDYGLFKVGTLVCEDGSQVPVGKVTLGTGHANAQWGVMPSREHYDNTGWAAAVVTVGEDQHGIWVNGALTSTMTPERVVALRASALSGDWRQVNGNLELIAALAVNNPGFPIYRETNGRAFSLQAVGVLGADDNISGEFSVGSADNTSTDQVQEPTESQPEAGDADAQFRAQRLAEIGTDWDQHARSKRLAQLTVLDEERDKVTAPKPTPRSQFRFNQQYDARYFQVPEDDE